MSTQPPREYELPLEAYRLLAKLLQHEEALFWRRNDVFLALNGGLVVVLGLIRPPQAETVNPTPKILTYMICSIGLVMCFLWLTTVRRSEAFYNHWYEQLKFLEKQYLAPISVFQIADEYFAKGRIKLGEEEFKLDFLSRQMRIYHALIGAPLVFLVAWLSLSVYLLFA
jgi:hypothetical protein